MKVFSLLRRFPDEFTCANLIGRVGFCPASLNQSVFQYL
ncbi:Uncharacterized protein dnm_029980 [Desulfonema magnum]|uniref:Uncharacterized protein n=1 Tax=Desulfonema magnum TaxID=45655 RepID=A0A975BK43_9BACT|nr:Uncharacterized protein dnm_029980 [Desulfonema magnum]